MGRPLARIAFAGAVAVAVAVPGGAAAADSVDARLDALESRWVAHPRQAATDLAALATDAVGAEPATKRRIWTLRGLALVRSNRTADAFALADVLDGDRGPQPDRATLAAALLIRSAAYEWLGDSVGAFGLAEQARERASDGPDAFMRYASALSAGRLARQMNRIDVARSHLENALDAADFAGSAYRRSAVHYQLSTLALQMNQPEQALRDAQEAFREAERAGSAVAAAGARMAESAALERLGRADDELAAMEQALAIARRDRSPELEGLALVNLADVKLRRRDYKAAYEISRQSLELARVAGDDGRVAVNTLNMGFALMGMGRTDAGKRLADEAVLHYERSGATAEIVETLHEYADYLELAGDYRAALQLKRREQRVNEDLARERREKTALEMQAKFDVEKRSALMQREQEEEQRLREVQQLVWIVIGAGGFAALLVVGLLYGKLRVTNRLLAQRNAALKVQSSRDPLTALYNRRHFQEYIDAMPTGIDRRRAAQPGDVQALLLIDIDHFKEINDRHGHVAGDAVLVAIASRLRETLRGNDMIVRWGGEEFLVFVPAAPPEGLDEIVARIVRAVGDVPIEHEGASIAVTVSVGFAPMPLPPDGAVLNWDGAISLVDKALYVAKTRGRNRACGIRAYRGARGASGVPADVEQAWRDGRVDLHMLDGGLAQVPVAG